MLNLGYSGNFDGHGVESVAVGILLPGINRITLKYSIKLIQPVLYL